MIYQSSLYCGVVVITANMFIIHVHTLGKIANIIKFVVLVYAQ